MAQPQTPWHSTQDYVALTRRDIPPGGRTDYGIVKDNVLREKAKSLIVVPHPAGATPTDVTSFVYGWI